MLMNKKDRMHPEDQKNLIFFAITALIVWLYYDHTFIQPKLAAIHAAEQAAKMEVLSGNIDPTTVQLPRQELLAKSPRLAIDNGTVAGSIDLTGGRLDDLRLLKYSKVLDGQDKVALLSPNESENPLYVEFGWIGDDNAKIKIPDPKTVWQPADPAAVLKPGSPVTIFWDNGEGLRFERTFDIDGNYMFTVTQRLVNHSKDSVTLYPYALISQQGLPAESMGKRIHEGPISYLDGKLTEIAYAKMNQKFVRQDAAATTGWIGITQAYWFTGLVPPQNEATKYSFSHVQAPTKKGRDRYQVDEVGAPRTAAPGQSAEIKTQLFAGAKEVKLLDQYENDLKIPHLDLAVDFGIYYFMTKPLFLALHYFYRQVGNMGVAIMMLTVVVRLMVFPLANMSFKSFAGLRKIGPQMKEVRDKYSDDQVRLQKELVALYEKEKVNPAAGCLPLIVQIPIFFALYKVMVITIELRHAPFFGWIHDLSAPDPTTLFNLFGLIHWNPPIQLMIGAWPCMMLGVQLLQRNMNPPPQDKMQAMMINFMPFFFCYIMAQFASGLVIYWTFSGLLAMIQQYVIMRSMGVEVKFFRRAKSERDMEKDISEQPTVHPGLEVLEHQIDAAIEGDPEPLLETPEPGDAATSDNVKSDRPAKNPAARTRGGKKKKS